VYLGCRNPTSYIVGCAQCSLIVNGFFLDNLYYVYLCYFSHLRIINNKQNVGVRMNLNCQVCDEAGNILLSSMIMMIMMMRVMIATNIHNKTGGIVTDHVHKLTVKTQFVNLILSILTCQ